MRLYVFSVAGVRNCCRFILIDEYDCQMTANINNETLYKQFQEKIKSFYEIGRAHV